MARNIYYISMKRDKKTDSKQWQIKKEGAERPLKITKTKAKIVERGQELVESKKATVVIFKLDGSIEKTLKAEKHF